MRAGPVTVQGDERAGRALRIRMEAREMRGAAKSTGGEVEGETDQAGRTSSSSSGSACSTFSQISETSADVTPGMLQTRDRRHDCQSHKGR